MNDRPRNRDLFEKRRAEVIIQKEKKEAELKQNLMVEIQKHIIARMNQISRHELIKAEISMIFLKNALADIFYSEFDERTYKEWMKELVEYIKKNFHAHKVANIEVALDELNDLVQEFRKKKESEPEVEGEEQDNVVRLFKKES
ncbi:MAG: hypothetical protein ABH832_01650 [bacterium]